MSKGPMIAGGVLLLCILIVVIVRMNSDTGGGGKKKTPEALQRSKNPPPTTNDETETESESESDDAIPVAPEVNYPINCTYGEWTECEEGDTVKTRKITLRNNSLGQCTSSLSEPCPLPEEEEEKVEGTYYSSIYGLYGSDAQCEFDEYTTTFSDDVREGGGGETIHLCGKKTRDGTDSGIIGIGTFEDDCPAGGNTVMVGNTNEKLDLKKEAGGDIWRLCYQTGSPGAKNIVVVGEEGCRTGETAISAGNPEDGGTDIMSGLDGQFVTFCST